MRYRRFCVLVGVCVSISAATLRAADAPPSFVNDVVPLLTRLGCNQGACHGRLSGQNGFRLSLRGFAPDQDFVAITREFGGRRVNRAVPNQSAILQKPLGGAPHEGGVLIARGSADHLLLQRWLSKGMPGPLASDPRLVSLKLDPSQATLAVGGKVPLRVLARFSDGSVRDVTDLTRFESNDSGQLRVSANGEVQAVGPGENAIRCSYQAEVTAAIFTVPFGFEVPAELYTSVAANNKIDDLVMGKLASLRIEPARLCTDAAFLRRVTLDLIGLLPTPAEVRAFVADSRADKRQRVIDSLLQRPEFTDYWTLFLADLLQNRRERDHDVRGVVGVRRFHAWLRREVATNRPWDQLARSVITATGNTAENPAVGYYVVTVGEHQEPHRSEAAASVAQAFLGTRIGCAQCHNHPLERYTQDDYYHFAAFFSRVKLDRRDPKDGPTNLRMLARESAHRMGVVQPRTGEFLAPRPLDRLNMSILPHTDPRYTLADWMTSPSNEAFAGAMVNRLWRHFLGVGLVEPVDDLRATNPPSNSELWKYLCQQFVESRFDLKHVMRLIVSSRTYQLDSATAAGNRTDTRFYSHFYPRRLGAEVLLDAVCQATESPEQFPGYPVGIRAVQVPDPALSSYFLGLFGRSQRVTACACERVGEVTLPQLLHLQNGIVVDKTRAHTGRLARLLRENRSDDQIVDDLFLATVSRLPKSDERQNIRKAMKSVPRDVGLEDLFWTLLNSKEFSFNH